MNVFRKITKKYRWGFIGVWTLIMAGCLGTLYCVGVVLIPACTPAPTKRQATIEATAPVFTLPRIPATITEPSERAKWLAAHYWDNFNFTDTTWINSPDVMEQAFVDYIDVLPHTTKQIAGASLRETLVKARTVQPVFDWFTGQFDKYLYDPNSPLRNEEMYAVIVEHIIADPKIDTLYKVRPHFQLEEINKNRQGNVAADFTYTLYNGGKEKLHSLKADYTLVFFNNPNCGDCKRTKEVLAGAKTISDLVAGGRMIILAIYTDEDVTLWKAAAKDMPVGWINARDTSKGLVVKSDLYAIRAIPSLYLLDRDKRVLLKDATAEQVVMYLGGQ